MLSFVVRKLDDSGNAALEHLGKLGYELTMLKKAKLPVVECVLVDKEACLAYQRGALTHGFYDDLWTAAAEIADQGSDLFIRSSPPDDSVWCEDNVRVRPDRSALRNAIERVFRSVSSPRSRASRLSAVFADDAAAPGIVIQEFATSLWSVGSRHPRTGQPIDESNWAAGIVSNNLPPDPRPYLRLARRCERVLGKPVQVAFSAANVQVTSVQSAMMADVARLEAVIDLYDFGVIDGPAVLREIQPSMLGYFQRYELDPANRIGFVRGIDASPGQVIGAVALRGFDRRLFTELPPVLCLKEMTPDDVQDITDSAAVISAVGGKSSHAAVFCRSIGLPCVCTSELAPSEPQRGVRLTDGSLVRECTTVAVDGTTGVAEFSDAPLIVPKYVTVRHKADRLHKFKTILNLERASPRFRQMSLDDQKHLAALTHRLTELRLM